MNRMRSCLHVLAAEVTHHQFFAPLHLKKPTGTASNLPPHARTQSFGFGGVIGAIWPLTMP